MPRVVWKWPWALPPTVVPKSVSPTKGPLAKIVTKQSWNKLNKHLPTNCQNQSKLGENNPNMVQKQSKIDPNTPQTIQNRPLPYLTLPYPTWTFAGHQSPSFQTYSDAKHTNRKPPIKSTILDGQTLDLSLPGHVYTRKTKFLQNLICSSLAKLHHTSGIKSCASPDGFNAVLDRF